MSICCEELYVKILDEYKRNYNIEAESYRMMGKMLNRKYVIERAEKFNIKKTYIYGGTYLAEQLRRMLCESVEVMGIIDKRGQAVSEIEMPVITLKDLRKCYLGEKIIIALPRFYREVKRELLEFIEEDNIILLGDFLEGML